MRSQGFDIVAPGAAISRATTFFRLKKSGERSYVQIVENTAPCRQSVIANLGRANETRRLGRVGLAARFVTKLTDQVLLINALDEDADGPLYVSARRIGGPLRRRYRDARSAQDDFAGKTPSDAAARLVLKWRVGSLKTGAGPVVSRHRLARIDPADRGCPG